MNDRSFLISFSTVFHCTFTHTIQLEIFEIGLRDLRITASWKMKMNGFGKYEVLHSITQRQMKENSGSKKQIKNTTPQPKEMWLTALPQGST